ncbi:6-phosphofructokinase, partial [Staphylococcus hominis]|uniref:6-phosphofructokinase n=1 Tax=Staphylococcus hominis TaxID=1290 RepID=UPI00164372F2
LLLAPHHSYTGPQPITEQTTHIKTIPIPPTIHNHINPTHFTIPFHTPLNTIIHSLHKITHTPSTHPRTFVVELMPPHCPHLALCARLSL